MDLGNSKINASLLLKYEGANKSTNLSGGFRISIREELMTEKQKFKNFKNEKQSVNYAAHVEEEKLLKDKIRRLIVMDDVRVKNGRREYERP